MKVTVTFGRTVVVVPCKDGWTVGDLIFQATKRYNKVLDQDGQFVVRTFHVEYSEGGILDQDDLLGDLVEDRDKLVAVFEQQEVHPRASVSPADSDSTGLSSPDSEAYEPQPATVQPPTPGEIEVTASTLKANTPLLVRSSSDSALAPPLETPSPHPDDPSSRPPETDATSHALNPKGGATDRRTEAFSAKMNRILNRSLTRTMELVGFQGPLGIHIVPYSSSMSGRTLGLLVKGIEENSRTQREGLLQPDECIVQINDTPLIDKAFAQSQDVFRQAMSSSLVRLEVLPVANKQRYEKSLISQLFIPEGHDLDTRARSPLVLPAITAVKQDLKPDLKQDLKPDLKHDLKSDLKHDLKSDLKHDLKPVHEQDLKPDFKQDPKLEVRQPDLRTKTPEPTFLSAPPVDSQTGQGSGQRPASASPTPRGRSESPLPRTAAGLPGLVNLASKKGGKKLKIDLKKGTEGLGFTVVTRDASVHGPGPILVKNILPRGAAIKDGRLQPGDRILEVNGVDMCGRTQEELVAMLRSTKQGESVCVVVARPEEIFLPRELKGEEAGSLLTEDGREQLTYEVPLNDTGSAGLGVSLKGNKSRETGEDLGIFIKSIIHGGAAHKDGRLCVNDQLVAVNGEPLQGLSNHAAMETLRHSMTWEGTARGTIQLVLLRSAARPDPDPAPSGPAQESLEVEGPRSWTPDPAPGPPAGPAVPQTRPPLELHPSGASQRAMVTNELYHSVGAPHPDANGSPPLDEDEAWKEEEQIEEDFPPPPSPEAVEDMNEAFPLAPVHPREMDKVPHVTEAPQPDRQQYRQTDNSPPSRTSKSMDLVADESNMGALARQSPEPSPGGALGPTLGLVKSSSLESLLTAVSEANNGHAAAPFHRPRPNMVRGRGCNQSFRFAIDRSYEGPSEGEDDDDISEASSGRDTPTSTSSRQELLEGKKEEKKKKKTKGRKKEKKTKEKKKKEDAEDPEKKTRKKGIGLFRFGKKKEEKTKEAKADKHSGDELDKILEENIREEPRYTEVSRGVSPQRPPLPLLEDDDYDPNYARINAFRKPPSPSPHLSRTPSPTRALVHAPPPGPAHSRQPSAEDLEGLYAKVNKQRPPAQQPAPGNSERVQQPQRDQQGRPSPTYMELDFSRRRAPDYDHPRMAERAPNARPAPRYEEVDRQYHAAQPRRVDPNDHPSQSRPRPREPASQGQPLPHLSVPQASEPPHGDPRYYAPPSPQPPRPGHHYETVGRAATRQASPGRYVSPERRDNQERYASPERYGYRDGRQKDPRRKNPLVGAV